MANRRCAVKTTWTHDFAYVIGIITSDGNLSPDGRHISITSKDFQIVSDVKRILGLKNVIGKKARGGSTKKEYHVFQFGDINFYEFLLSIGLMPAKSKKLSSLSIPRLFFPDFLRGCIDGDGTIGHYIHKESRFRQIRLRLVSASPLFLHWILNVLKTSCAIEGGHLYAQKRTSVSILSFGIRDSVKILKLMYYASDVPALSRKREKALQYVEVWTNGQVVK